MEGGVGGGGWREAGRQMSRWLSPEPEHWNQPGCPHPILSPLLKHLGSAAGAAPGEVRDPLRNLTEEEDEGRGRH